MSDEREYPIYVPGQAGPVGWLPGTLPYIGCVSCGRASADCRCKTSRHDEPAETELRWSICTDCGTRDLVTGLRDPLCAYCGELRTLPPRPLTGRRPPYRLIAAVWTCCTAAGVLIWFVPPSARMIVNLAIWTVALAAWAAIGWRALGRRRRRGH